MASFKFLKAFNSKWVVQQEKGKKIPNRIYTPNFILDNFKL